MVNIYIARFDEDEQFGGRSPVAQSDTVYFRLSSLTKYQSYQNLGDDDLRIASFYCSHYHFDCVFR